MINPTITNLIPISLSPSVKALTNKSIKINDNPNKNTSIPIVINALNNGPLLLIEILLHQYHNMG